MEKLNLYENEPTIDAVETGPISQLEHRARKVELYRKQRPLGVPMPEVVVEQIEPEVGEGE